jgi:hypothetical protein
MTLKSDLYNLLKDSPAELTTSYALYTVEQLVGELKDAGIMVQDVDLPEVQAVAETEVEAPDLILPDDGEPEVVTPPTPVAESLPSSLPLSIPVRGMDPNEMAGQRLNTQPEDVPIRINPHPAEVKVTLPSYQVGIYKDPRFPFKIHCYSDREGFNFFEVADFYGGVELVPQECKRIYIENDLCYDIRSVVRAIQNEHRQLQLMGKVQ